MRKRTLLNGKQTVMKGSLLSGIGLAMLLGSATVSLAQQDNKGSSSKCTCSCYGDSGAGGAFLTTNTYNSNGLSCGAFDNRTCNVDVPGVGIRTGRLLGCSDASSSTGAARGITILPHGSATLAESKPPKTTTSKVPVTGTTTQRK